MNTVRLHHPLTDHLDDLNDLIVDFIGVVESQGVDNDKLIAVSSMTQHPISETAVVMDFRLYRFECSWTIWAMSSNKGCGGKQASHRLSHGAIQKLFFEECHYY